VARARFKFDPYLHDSEQWGVSLAQMNELIIPCLDTVGARLVVEVGAYAGDLTRVLVAWAESSEARVMAVDPQPQADLDSLASASSRLDLIRQTSFEALLAIPLPDVVIVDGDHNYFTVTQELRLIDERAAGAPFPLLLLHDVSWPHGRRDDYYAIDQIPPEARHPVVGPEAGIFPGDPGTRRDGLPYPRSAAREGGPRNGVLTAVEDFVATRPELHLAVVPAFFGLGAVWHDGARWASDLAALLAPWDRHPILERLEHNRVNALATRHACRVAQWGLEARLSRQESVLRRLLESSAFALAEQLSRLRVRAGIARDQRPVTRDEVSRALER
jgi:hypothetical protein